MISQTCLTQTNMNTSLINLNEVPFNRVIFTLFVFIEMLKSSFNMIQNYNISMTSKQTKMREREGLNHFIYNIPPNMISQTCLAHYKHIHFTYESR